MPNWLDSVFVRMVVRLLVGTVDGKLSETAGWRTRLGAALVILTGTVSILTGLASGIDAFVQHAGDPSEILTQLDACWPAILKGIGTIGAGIAALGLRRAIGTLTPPA